MSGFQEIFDAYGADYNATMGRFLNNETMYLKFLDMMFKDENMAKLGEALEAGDYEAAFVAGHTLKGVTGNMGLTPLYDAVCAIVEPLRKKQAGNDYSGLYRAIQAEYEKADGFRVKLKEGR